MNRHVEDRQGPCPVGLSCRHLRKGRAVVEKRSEARGIALPVSFKDSAHGEQARGETQYKVLQNVCFAAVVEGIGFLLIDVDGWLLGASCRAANDLEARRLLWPVEAHVVVPALHDVVSPSRNRFLLKPVGDAVHQGIPPFFSTLPPFHMNH